MVSTCINWNPCAAEPDPTGLQLHRIGQHSTLRGKTDANSPFQTENEERFRLSSHGGFLKWWASPTNPWVFLLKMISTWGVLGVPLYIWKHPHKKTNKENIQKH